MQFLKKAKQQFKGETWLLQLFKVSNQSQKRTNWSVLFKKKNKKQILI